MSTSTPLNWAHCFGRDNGHDWYSVGGSRPLEVHRRIEAKEPRPQDAQRLQVGRPVGAVIFKIGGRRVQVEQVVQIDRELRSHSAKLQQLSGAEVHLIEPLA